MAHSHNNLRFLCLLLAPLGAHAATTADTAPPHGSAASLSQPLNPQQKINVDCASGKVDYKTHIMVCRNIVISQGSTRVRADHARGTGGLNFQNSRWTFAGNVQIDAPPRGSLRSDQATVEFRDNRLADATITGNPAEFEQQRADDLGMEKGHADQIVYDVDQGTVLLTKDAWISDGHNEMSAPSIAYSIREQKVLASSAGASQGVHITITPQAAPKEAPPKSAAPQGKGAAGPPHSSSTPHPPAPTPPGHAGRPCARPGSRRATNPVKSSAISASRSRTARWLDFSDPTARARPPPST
jgi:lipopolysaccharide transport protein LptA